MRLKRALFLLILVCAIFFVNVCIFSVRNQATNDRFHYDPAESVPLLLMGSFRGVAVDFLWARAIARFEEKKYYELLTINNLISKLQPNFPAVWIFQSWNMAYNIAHEWDSPQNKWKWIYTGLNYAKKGAEKNPKSGDLFFEIGYMYLHLFDKRVFKYADYYRKQLKQEDGKDNYEEALYWLRKALLNNPKFHNISAIERTVCHALWYASVCAEEECNFEKAIDYAESAINEWKIYRSRHPDDTTIKADEFIDMVERKREFLQSLLIQKGDGFK